MLTYLDACTHPASSCVAGAWAQREGLVLSPHPRAEKVPLVNPPLTDAVQFSTVQLFSELAVSSVCLPLSLSISVSRVFICPLPGSRRLGSARVLGHSAIPAPPHGTLVRTLGPGSGCRADMCGVWADLLCGEKVLQGGEREGRATW